MKEQPILLFKYGGNAMSKPDLQKEVMKNICALRESGYKVVVVHGGGPFIKEVLAKARIESEFIDGQRKTSPEALEYVEMALKGKVNGQLVSIANSFGYPAVGLSGKDGRMVLGEKRLYKRIHNGTEEVVDMGQVGDVAEVNLSLLHLLLDNNYIPIITCLATGQDGQTYNVNGDMFAGHLAGALGVSQYIVLTDVDGLLKDVTDSKSIIRKLKCQEIANLKENGVIKGGMIPKVESCEIALNAGAASARIINGTVPEQISKSMEEQTVGTLILKN